MTIHFTFFDTPDGNNWIWGLRHGLFEVLKCNLSYVIPYLLQKHFTNKGKGRPQCYFFYLIVNSIVMLLRKLQILVRYILYPTVPYIFQAVRLSSTYLPTDILPTYYLLRTTSSFKHIHFYLYYKSGKVSQRISRTIHFWWLQTLPKPFNKNGEEESKENFSSNKFEENQQKRIAFTKRFAMLTRIYNTGCPVPNQNFSNR